MKTSSDQLDFDFSRPIDIQRNLDIMVLKNLSDFFLDQKNNETFFRHLKFLINELYLCWMESEDQFLSVSMSKRGYRLSSRYNPNNISSYLIKTIRFFESEKFIELYPGFYDAKRNKSRLTRIRSSQTLNNHFRNIKLKSIQNQLCYLYVNNKKKENLLIYKKGNLLEYKDSYETQELKNVLENYNKLISRTFFDIPNLVESFLIRGDKKKIAVSSFGSCTYTLNHDLGNKGTFGGCWWNKLDLNLLLQIKDRLIINHQTTSHIDLLDFFGEFLSDLYGTNIILQPKYFSKILNYDQSFYLIIKGIQSKNYKSFVRSVFNEKERLSIHNLSKVEIEKSIQKQIHENKIIFPLLYGGKSINWKEFVSEVFYELVKKLNNVDIPTFLVREKLFFPTSMSPIFLDKISATIEKKLKIRSVKIRTRKCLPFKFEKESFFGRFIKSKLNFSKRYLMKKELFGIE